MKRFIKPAILVLCLVALTASVVAQKSADSTNSGLPLGGYLQAQDQNPYTGDSLMSSAGTPVDYIQVAEDIEIMSRIIDKSLEEKFSDNYKASSMFREFQGCQGIYLKGYGAIFVTSIGFPVAEIEVPEQKDAPDELWIRMKSELRGESTSGSGAYGISYKDAAEKYDAEKVKQLKEELLKLVGTYAPNIRNLGSGENVVVAVRGSSSFGKIIRSIVYDTRSDAMIVEKSLSVFGSAEPGSPEKTLEITKPPSMSEPVVAPPEEAPEAVTPSTVAPSKSVPQLVQGAAARRRSDVVAATVVGKKPDGKSYTMVLSDGISKGRTNLIIKVGKGDIIAYKDGKLDHNAFMKKAEIIQY